MVRTRCSVSNHCPQVRHTSHRRPISLLPVVSRSNGVGGADWRRRPHPSPVSRTRRRKVSQAVTPVAPDFASTTASSAASPTGRMPSPSLAEQTVSREMIHFITRITSELRRLRRLLLHTCIPPHCTGRHGHGRNAALIG